MKNTSDKETNKPIDIAWKKFSKKDFQGAEKLFLEIYEAENDTESLYGYACSLLRKGEGEQAAEMFDKLIEADKNNAKAYHMRGLSYGADENYAAAIKDLEKAIELTNDSHEALCDLGGTYLAMKKYKDAAQYFEKAVTSDGKCHEAWMGKALAAYFNKELKAALEFLNITLKLNPKNLLALLTKAEILLEMGKNSEVEKEVNKILAIDPSVFKKKSKETDEEEEGDEYDMDEDANRSEDDEIEEFDLDD
jgi:tetratricopeptide (TPR) repeat protein